MSIFTHWDFSTHVVCGEHQNKVINCDAVKSEAEEAPTHSHTEIPMHTEQRDCGNAVNNPRVGSNNMK